MEKINKLFTHKIFRILKWAFLILLSAYIILVIFRVFHFVNLDKTNAQVEKIHNTKITIDDVLGKNLPPDPGVDADKTVEGIDANRNGIRDDVELAIFKKYPDSAKTRAVLLQYALALQMEFTQPIINTDTVIASIQEEDRSYQCIGNILIRDDNNQKIMDEYFKEADFLSKFIYDKEFNSLERKNYRTNFYEKIGSYNSLNNKCDIDISKLPN